MKNWQGREGLSASCQLAPAVATGILMGGREHPCDRCNMDRTECDGFPRKDSKEPQPPTLQGSK